MLLVTPYQDPIDYIDKKAEEYDGLFSDNDDNTAGPDALLSMFYQRTRS